MHLKWRIHIIVNGVDVEHAYDKQTIPTSSDLRIWKFRYLIEH